MCTMVNGGHSGNAGMKRWLPFLLAMLWLVGVSAPVQAAPRVLGHDLCHAVDAAPAALNAPLPTFHCGDTPTGYQSGSLWLRVDLGPLHIDRNDLTLMMHNSRFDRLRVGFAYTDGTIRWQEITTGGFGAHWRAGGQIVFAAPRRDVPLSFMVLRFDHLASLNLLRLRLMAGDEASLEATLLATAVGAALTLLLLGAIYNVSLAVAVRRQFPAWQGAWAGCMVVWGAFWSQAHLLILPEWAGAPSAQICTGLSCLAITLATQSAMTALGQGDVPQALRRLTIALGLAVGVLGIPLSMMRHGPIEMWANVLGVLILADLLVVALSMTLAWRRGSGEARAFAGAWVVPMIALASAQFLDTDTLLWGGGSQMLVLLAAAWQTLWLSVAATHRFARMRLERDRAMVAQASAQEQARRDALTGLRNRRGFIEIAQGLLDGGGALALLLLDVDKFKAINDTHGHEVGDTVLCTLARRLERWDGDLCTVARFGGEEFGLMIVGLSGPALAQFAESVREGIATCDHGADLGPITVSVGVAQADPSADFQTLYRMADEALYEAKRQGRNRVAIAGRPGPSTAQEPHPLLHTA